MIYTLSWCKWLFKHVFVILSMYRWIYLSNVWDYLRYWLLKSKLSISKISYRADIINWIIFKLIFKYSDCFLYCENWVYLDISEIVILKINSHKLIRSYLLYSEWLIHKFKVLSMERWIHFLIFEITWDYDCWKVDCKF